MADQGGQGRVKLPRAAPIKNKQAAPMQITAEQILREAADRQEAEPKPPRQKITDPGELEEYRQRKRKGFEDSVRRQRTNISIWIKYAQWEDSQHEYERARSIFERAIDVDYRNVNLWLKYAEMEMKHKLVNHARNIWDRAVTLLPRIDQFWYKYSFMEETLGNFSAARAVLERWMQWKPDPHAWMTYIKFELRRGELARARGIFERYVQIHPTIKSWVRYAKFEDKNGDFEKARAIYERAVQALGEEANDEKLFIPFAKFEERMKEVERARTIYRYALDHIPKAAATELYKTFISFEKQFGDKDAIEDVIVGKRRFQYEEEIKLNPRNYDAWFDYIRLEELAGDKDRIREVYERAIANLPPANEKRLWRRYIFFWIYYAVYEELSAGDAERAREVYKECLKVVPHSAFSFSKVWILFAKFELRQKQLDAARAILGNAIGKAPKDKIFKFYVELEQQLANIDRCRKLYEKYIEWNPANCNAWLQFAKMEANLQERERARAIFEYAISQPLLDMPEVLWKAYIDFEIEGEEEEKTRDLYRRLLARTKHVKVWISFAQWERVTNQNVKAARDIFSEASEYFKSAIITAMKGGGMEVEGATSNVEELKEERVGLIAAWCEMEKEEGDQEALAKVQALVPKKVRKRREIRTEDEEGGVRVEEYVDYLFPDMSAAPSNLKLLEMAKAWKQKQLAAKSDDDN